MLAFEIIMALCMVIGFGVLMWFAVRLTLGIVRGVRRMVGKRYISGRHSVTTQRV